MNEKPALIPESQCESLDDSIARCERIVRELKRWRERGCGYPVTVLVPRGWEYREEQRPCGSVLNNGDIETVIRCSECWGNK